MNVLEVCGKLTNMNFSCCLGLYEHVQPKGARNRQRLVEKDITWRGGVFLYHRAKYLNCASALSATSVVEALRLADEELGQESLPATAVACTGTQQVV